MDSRNRLAGINTATDGVACANSLSGTHEAYHIEILFGRPGVEQGPRPTGLVIRCAQCGALRLEDFAISTVQIPVEDVPADMPVFMRPRGPARQRTDSLDAMGDAPRRYATETTIANLTGRRVLIRFANGEQHTMDPEDPDAPAARHHVDPDD